MRADEACGEPTFNLGVSEVCGPAIENGVEMWRQGKCGEQPREKPNLACPGSVPEWKVERTSECLEGEITDGTEKNECNSNIGDFDRNRGCRVRTIRWFCRRPAVLNTCRTPENGVEDIICRSPQFGIERAASCRNRIFGVERFATCRLRKNRSELERFFIGFDSSFENFAILLAENYSGYLAAVKGRNEMGCFLKEVQNDTLLADVFEKNRTLFSALFGGEVWSPENFVNCSDQAATQKNILKEKCDGQSDLRKCAFVKGYRSAFNWLLDQLQEARLLRKDHIARNSANEMERLKSMSARTAETLF